MAKRKNIIVPAQVSNDARAQARASRAAGRAFLERVNRREGRPAGRVYRIEISPNNPPASDDGLLLVVELPAATRRQALNTLARYIDGTVMGIKCLGS